MAGFCCCCCSLQHSKAFRLMGTFLQPGRASPTEQSRSQHRFSFHVFVAAQSSHAPSSLPDLTPVFQYSNTLTLELRTEVLSAFKPSGFCPVTTLQFEQGFSKARPVAQPGITRGGTLSKTEDVSPFFLESKLQDYNLRSQNTLGQILTVCLLL